MTKDETMSWVEEISVAGQPAFCLRNAKEYLILSNKKHLIEQKLKNYIKDYKKALKNMKDKKNLLLVKHSSLQYFHAELKI